MNSDDLLALAKKVNDGTATDEEKEQYIEGLAAQTADVKEAADKL